MADRQETPVDGGQRPRRAISVLAARASVHAARIRQLAGRLTVRESQLFLLLAALIGVLAGMAVVCFRIAIESTRIWMLGSGLAPAAVFLACKPYPVAELV